MTYQASSIVNYEGIRPARNSSGADIAQDVFVELVPAGTEDPAQIRLPNAAGDQIYGVTLRPIKNGQIGDVQIKGRAKILAGSGGIAIGGNIAATTAGAGVTAASGNVIAGSCVAAAAAGAVGEIELAGPTGARAVP